MNGEIQKIEKSLQRSEKTLKDIKGRMEIVKRNLAQCSSLELVSKYADVKNKYCEIEELIKQCKMIISKL